MSTAEAEIAKLPGLKCKELQKCFCCGRGHGAANITFYQLTISRFIFDPRAIQERHGMETMMGGGIAGAVLAEVMGPDRDLAKQISGPFTIQLCEDCGCGIGQRTGSFATVSMPCMAEIVERCSANASARGEDDS